MSDEELAKLASDKVNEIAKLVQEYVHITDHMGTGLLTSAVVIFEATQFDDEGRQVYRVDYFTLPPTSMTQVAGLISIGEKEMNHRLFCHGTDLP